VSVVASEYLSELQTISVLSAHFAEAATEFIPTLLPATVSKHSVALPREFAQT
jgi:hypothetical protein